MMPDGSVTLASADDRRRRPGVLAAATVRFARDRLLNADKMRTVIPSTAPGRVINASAPIRICDNGGWTDTWFAGQGKVLNIGVNPGVHVQIRTHPDVVRGRVVLRTSNFGEHDEFELHAPPHRHPLLEAVIEDIGLPQDTSVEISISCEVPPGCSTGTSAAVTVALIAALDALAPGRMMTPYEIAYAAHRIEVDRLGIESGIQDQLCAAFGGINYIDIYAYPNASISQVVVSPTTRLALERRLVLLYLGRTHDSSDVHQRVIADLTREEGQSDHLQELRVCAERAANALAAGDLTALGRSMIDNTAAQRRLHGSLVSPEAELAIAVATAHGAPGWKVNGAGGNGGSLTLLCPSDTEERHRLLHSLTQADPLFRAIPISLNGAGLHLSSEPEPSAGG
jgi:D-glycero-alpha-D-manno-heptose-7-phosphate kinase